MSAHAVPGGSLVALATPFRDGALDMPALSAMVARQVGAGTLRAVMAAVLPEEARASRQPLAIAS